MRRRSWLAAVAMAASGVGCSAILGIEDIPQPIGGPDSSIGDDAPSTDAPAQDRVVPRAACDGHPAGALDDSFGDGGVSAHLPGIDEFGNAAVVRPFGLSVGTGGEIVVPSSGDPDGRLRILRLDTAGRPDPSFGDAGLATISDPSPPPADGGATLYGEGAGGVITSGDTAYLAGTRYAPGEAYPFLVRVNPKGALDRAFGTGGMILERSYPLTESFALAYRSGQNRFFVAGTVAPRTDNSKIAVFQAPNSGAAVTAFSVDFPRSVVLSAAVQAIGTIVVSGYREVAADVDSGAGMRLFVARLKDGGGFDTSFNAGGWVDIAHPTETSANPVQAPIIVDEPTTGPRSFVVAGSFGDVGKEKVLVARVSDDGVVQRIFDSLAFDDHFVRALAIQPDRKILVGATLNVGSSSEFLIARYLTDGTIDRSFGTSGVVRLKPFLTHELLGLAVQPTDGRIVVTGTACTSPGQKYCALGSTFVVQRLCP